MAPGPERAHFRVSANVIDPLFGRYLEGSQKEANDLHDSYFENSLDA